MRGVSKNKRLRYLLESKEISVVAGAHDGLSAKIAEISGFDAIWASGLGISAVHAVPDESILTMTEFLNASVVINESCALPVIADCDSGFGDINNVRRLVQKYDGSGISGICIEDKVFPKRNSFSNGQQILAPIKEFATKINVAKESQNSPDFTVIARVEAFIAGLSQKEAYRRAASYVEAGADAILIHSKKDSPVEVFEFAQNWDKQVPLIVVPTKFPHVKKEEFRANGFSMVIYANQGLRASVRSMSKILNSIVQSGSSSDVEEEIATVEDIFNLQNAGSLASQSRKYEGTLK